MCTKPHRVDGAGGQHPLAEAVALGRDLGDSRAGNTRKAGIGAAVQPIRSIQLAAAEQLHVLSLLVAQLTLHQRQESFAGRPRDDAQPPLRLSAALFEHPAELVGNLRCKALDVQCRRPAFEGGLMFADRLLVTIVEGGASTMVTSRRSANINPPSISAPAAQIAAI